MVSKEEKILAIKASLKKAHPKWDEEKIVSTAFAIHNSQKKASKKEDSKFSAGEFFDCKENEGIFYSKGYAATTDYDRVGDILTVDCLEDMASQMNELKNIDSDEVSWRHDRSDPKPIAIAEHNASVVKKDDESYGLLVTTNHVKTHEKYDDYAYEVQSGVVKGYSIEYLPEIVLEDTRSFDGEGNFVDGHRILDKVSLRGYGYASGRFIANPEARLIEHGYKEIMKKGECADSEDDDSEEEEEKKKKKKMEGQKMSEQETIVKEVPSLSEEDKKILIQAKEAKKKQETLAYLKEIMKDDSLVSELAKKEVPNKVPIGNVEVKEQPMEYKEYAEIFTKGKELAIEEKFNRAGLLAEKMGLVAHDGMDGLIFKQSKPYEAKEGSAPKIRFKHFGTNGTKIEYKGLGITTNQNSDTDYLLSGAELSDVFNPVIWDALNQSQVTWNILKKDDFSNKGNNQVQFILETGANTTAAFYTGNSISTSNSTLLKMQTKFKKVQAGVAVDGDMIAAARGSPVGDVFALHVRLATKNLINVVNAAIFAEVGLETAAAIIGFEFIADSAGNATMYSLTRSTTNRLSPDSAGDTYIDGASAIIAKNNLRKCIEQANKEGGNIGNYVFITHPTQVRLLKNQYDDLQRIIPTSARVGFTGMMDFDGVPIFEDKDCTSDNWFLIDLETHRIAMWVPPTLEMLGKRSDSVEGFIKSYLATYNTVPRRLCMIYDNATS